MEFTKPTPASKKATAKGGMTPIVINVGGSGSGSGSSDNNNLTDQYQYNSNNNNPQNGNEEWGGNFLITYNNQLRQELQQEKVDNDRLSRSIEVLQREHEKFVQSNKYVRGILKNLIEIEQLSTTIVSVYSSHNDALVASGRQRIRKFNQAYRIFRFVMTILLLTLWQGKFITYLYFSVLLFSAVGIETAVSSLTAYALFFLSQQADFIRTEITPTKTRIAQIKKGQEFLDDYIDTLTSTMSDTTTSASKTTSQVKQQGEVSEADIILDDDDVYD